MTDRDLQEWGESRRMPDPSASEARRLVERAVARRHGRWARWLLLPLIPGGMGVAAAVALLILWFRWPATPMVTPPRVAAGTPAAEVLGDGVHPLGADVVEVDGEVAATREPARTVLALREGAVTVEAAKRAAGQALVVISDDWIVEVVGTRFTVVRSPFSVRVEEGVVAVQRGDERWTLRPGDRFERGRVVRPAVALPGLTELRRLLLAGEVEEARTGLGRRLEADPGEVGAWTLLGQLEARAGNRDAAVGAWREVVARGAAAEAQRGRFEAATLLEDRPAEAIPLLEAFLGAPDPLAAEAGLRLGRARLAVGDRDGARRALEAVVAGHPGSGPAELAQGLLRSW